MSRDTYSAKREFAESVLKRDYLNVYFKPKTHGVFLPPEHAKKHTLLLQFGHNMPVPITDLSVNIFAISGTLSFAGQTYWCRIPWDAIFGMSDQKDTSMIWLEDAPLPRPDLRLVKGGALLSKPAIGVLKLVE